MICFLQFDGSHEFLIPKEKVEWLHTHSNPYQNNYGSELKLNASVTETLTKKTYSGKTTVKLYRSAVTLKYADSNPETFKTGFPFQALIEVTRQDGSPLADHIVIVTSTTKPDDRAISSTYASDKDGYVIFRRNIGQNISSLRIEAKTRDRFGEEVSMHRKSLLKFRSNSNTYLGVTAESYEVQAGKEIVCHVKSTEKFGSLNFILLSRGNTIESKTVIHNPFVQTATLKFMATSIMSPTAKIVVYFIRNDGELVADSVTVKVNGAFENDVSVEFNTTQTKPGENVTVNVKASPNSEVGLLAVDKSVLLLDEGNDFSVSQVMEELESYGGDGSFPPWWRWRRRRSFFPWYPRAQDSLQIFEGVKLRVISDCKGVRNNNNFRYPYDYSRFPLMERMDMNVKAGLPLKEVTKVRTIFPETWLWETTRTNSAGQAQVLSKSPDTITSWVLSGFSVSNVTGFGVANEKPQLRVFQPFFLSLDLPYSVIRGEEVAIKVIVFNYENKEVKVTVTLKRSDDWENMVEEDENSLIKNSDASDVIHVIKVLANSGTAISFPIIPKKLGYIPITVHAQTTTSADGVRRTLLVEPEGIEQEYSYSLLIDLSSSAKFTKELELALPSDVVVGSPKGTISVIGDIMGSSISGIEKLLRMPYGCGEQNMINFAPSMFIRAYLENVGQLTPSIKEKSIKFMTSGYQRELTYQHSDGSYSAFGEGRGGRSGSLWLTAFVVKSFSRAKSYIYIDPAVQRKSLAFILSTQQRDGSFSESGRVSSYLQGGLKSSTPEALTAYVLVSLLESGDESSETKLGISKAVRFLKTKLSGISDVYTLALIAYAFELADDTAKETALEKLMTKAIREDGTLHWKQSSSVNSKSSPWLRPYYRPPSADVEITSYVLLVYAHRNNTQNGLPIAQWLAQQRNSLGGYSSTQDTVIGLQALSVFAPLVFSSDVHFTVDVGLSAKAGYSKSFSVNKDNLIVLQEEELPTVNGKVLISSQGKGIGVLQIGVTYNVKNAPTDNSFNVKVKVKNVDNNKVEAESCVRYTGDGQNSGMAILEFGLPSGFSLDPDVVPKLLETEGNKVEKIETPGKKAVLYFNEVPKSSDVCVKIKSVRTHAIGKTQPIPVIVYDYYKPEKRATTMYVTQDDVSVCDVCGECANCKPRPQETGHAEHVASISHILMLVFAIFLYYIH
ncbi:CD109 antigen-like isoform X2 [Dendronephthya gigantea]|uniref:CD109 antigen-like isoform X2 n=1 Tax=Dendronephthya gigantea TaxID=151771 RepID=UPI00106C30EA|nr:CD109 antigen-like isoform X2 [Dendronephthya gigantea]